MGRSSKGEITAPILQDILHIVHELKEATAESHSLSRRPIPADDSSNIAINSINLPNPPLLLPSLLEAGSSREIANEISRTYRLRAEELRRRIEDTVVATCREIMELPSTMVTSASSSDPLIRKVLSTFTQLYLRRLEQWKQEIIQRIKRAPKALVDPVASRKARTFNHEYVPLLERFFEENPFPTHADKMFLAEKSNMEYRQIHVWFQNRRNRTKKEGKQWRKKQTYESATMPLDVPHERAEGCVVDSGRQPPKPSRRSSAERATENNIFMNAFASSPPAHAFPSSYPPACHYHPFPCKSGHVCFGKPEWRRVPDGSCPLSLSVSIDDLVEMFSRLSVRDGARAKGSPKTQSQAATAAITVIPPCAPHPSLIISKYSQPADIVQLRPSVRAHVTCPKAFESPSPTSKPVTLVPPSVPHQKNQLPGKRKTVPLPRRFPGRMQDARRDTTPESSSTSPSSPRLFSTDCDIHNCSFSGISSLPTLSDTANIQDSSRRFGTLCRSPFDSPIYLRGLGEMAAISLSTVP